MSNGSFELGGPLHYVYELEGTSHSDYALRAAERPYSRKVSFKVSLQTALEEGSRNGFLVVHDATTGKSQDCGVLIGGQKYLMADLSSSESPNRGGFAIAVPNIDQSAIFHLVVEVDLEARSITMSVNGEVTAIAPLAKEIHSISHYGFQVVNTKTYFSEIVVEGD